MPDVPKTPRRRPTIMQGLADAFSLAANCHRRLQGEGDRRFHRQDHVPFSSERRAYRACRGSRSRANQRTRSAAGNRAYGRASTRAAADPQPVVLRVAAGLTRLGRLVLTSYVTPRKVNESRRSANAARPLNRPDSADVTTCPSNGVPRGTATRCPTTRGSSKLAEKPSPARFRLVSIVCASRTRTLVPGANTRPLRRDRTGADVGAAGVFTSDVFTPAYTSVGAVSSSATGVTCPLLHPAAASTKTLSALPRILFMMNASLSNFGCPDDETFRGISDVVKRITRDQSQRSAAAGLQDLRLIGIDDGRRLYLILEFTLRASDVYFIALPYVSQLPKESVTMTRQHQVSALTGTRRAS